MMTRERELLQQALDALDRAISDDRAYIRECKDAAEAIRAHLAAQPAPAEPVNREHAIALRDAELCGCEDMYFAARPQIDTLQARRIYAAGFKAGYEVRPPAQPLPAEPVALESVHLTRDINGMCTVRVNGRVAIQDNGDIIDHMATLEWFAQPAPVPLTDLQLSEIAVSDEFLLYCSQDEFNEIARAIERAHGTGYQNGCRKSYEGGAVAVRYIKIGGGK